MRRQTYQNGCVFEDKRRGGLWYWKYRDPANGKQQIKPLGLCANRMEALKKAGPLVVELNSGVVADRTRPSITFGTLVNRYIREELPARYSTQRGYLNYLNTHIVPKWGGKRISDVRPMGVDAWLKSLALSQKSKAHIKGIMHLLFEKAMFWEYCQDGANPMRLVRVKGQTRRTREPVNLTPDEFHALLANITKEPFRTMTFTALSLGLRFSELTGLKWKDIDWMDSSVHIQRGVVRGFVDETKTTSSNETLPIAPELLESWKLWRVKADFKGDDDWMFASPYFSGRAPYAYSHLLRTLKAAAAKAGIPRISWHSLRHSFRTWLGEAGVSVATQQKLMRHANYQTTMNIYGTVLDETLRKASTQLQQKIMNGKCSAD